MALFTVIGSSNMYLFHFVNFEETLNIINYKYYAIILIINHCH